MFEKEFLISKTLFLLMRLCYETEITPQFEETFF